MQTLSLLTDDLLINQIMQCWPKCLNLIILACGMDTICEKNHNKLFDAIHPD